MRIYVLSPRAAWACPLPCAPTVRPSCRALVVSYSEAPPCLVYCHFAPQLTTVVVLSSLRRYSSLMSRSSSRHRHQPMVAPCARTRDNYYPPAPRLPLRSSSSPIWPPVADHSFRVRTTPFITTDRACTPQVRHASSLFTWSYVTAFSTSRTCLHRHGDLV